MRNRRNTILKKILRALALSVVGFLFALVFAWLFLDGLDRQLQLQEEQNKRWAEEYLQDQNQPKETFL